MASHAWGRPLDDSPIRTDEGPGADPEMWRTYAALLEDRESLPQFDLSVLKNRGECSPGISADGDKQGIAFFHFGDGSYLIGSPYEPRGAFLIEAEGGVFYNPDFRFGVPVGKDGPLKPVT